MQDFRLQSLGLRDSKATDEEVYLLQQHYRMPTRLLDWTTSPLAALFFAVQDTDDGELFMMDASKFQLTAGADQPRKHTLFSFNREERYFPGIADTGHLIFRDAVKIMA
jgi:hypothetical protein